MVVIFTLTPGIDAAIFGGTGGNHVRGARDLSRGTLALRRWWGWRWALDRRWRRPGGRPARRVLFILALLVLLAGPGPHFLDALGRVANHLSAGCLDGGGASRQREAKGGQQDSEGEGGCGLHGVMGEGQVYNPSRLVSRSGQPPAKGCEGAFFVGNKYD